MKKDASLLVSLIALCLVSCKKYQPPKAELCISGANYSFQCNDMRRVEGQQDYDIAYPLNYICTNPQDYKTAYNYCADLRERLIKCERRRR